MSKFLTISVALFMAFGQLGYGQITNKSPLFQETPIYISGFDYPDFDGLSNYAWFKLNFPITEGTEFSIGAEHYRRFYADRITVPIQLKKYFSKKTYLLGGYQWEWDLFNEGKGYPNPTPRQESFFGVGHDVRSNMMIEARMVQPMGNPQFYKIGLEGVKTRLEVGTKLKF